MRVAFVWENDWKYYYKLFFSAEARLKKNRCANCFDCPVCGTTLTTRYTQMFCNHFLKKPLLDSEISLMVKLYIFQGYYGARAAAFPRAWRQGSGRGRCWQEDRQEDVLPGLWILPLDHSWYRAARSASGFRRLARARYDHSPFCFCLLVIEKVYDSFSVWNYYRFVPF